jgi:6-pyruvoyltetrahydropterin/6-carboxytetrahydropterin synthase
VTKRFKFSAAHHLPDDPGPCHRAHGHTFLVDVEAEGPIDERGMVVHFDELKDAWAELEPRLDHQDLNESLAGVAEPPTTENVAAWLFFAFREYVPEVSAVTLWEGPSSYARVREE